MTVSYTHLDVYKRQGLELDLLQNFIFITLDIFQKNMENKSIENELEAWLMFYSTQEPERIIELIDKYPMFRQMYGDVYEVCRNMEKVMGMFSEELREMDRNTVQYMIDEMQATIDAQAAALEEEKKKMCIRDRLTTVTISRPFFIMRLKPTAPGFRFSFTRCACCLLYTSQQSVYAAPSHDALRKPVLPFLTNAVPAAVDPYYPVYTGFPTDVFRTHLSPAP